ncbi:MAG: hypothetical protein K6T83_11785 [Alicyclobacillus sp.]|nr:hypothetical protein [Alicyclobacillus sp.]
MNDGVLSRKPVAYDVFLSVLYVWSVFQAYVFDAKTRADMTIFVVVYGVFTLLVRSPFGALLMNLLSTLSMFWIFTLPVMQSAADYFKFGTLFGILMTLGVMCVQGLLSICLMTWGRNFLNQRHQFVWSALIAVVFTTGLTLVASVID